MSSPLLSVPRSPTILIVMDGIGHNPSTLHNAVSIAKTPKIEALYSKNPVTVIEASGKPVGLPDGQMGNSEVGHITLGSGQVVRQDLVSISDSIDDSSFFSNPALWQLLETSKDNHRPLHLLGLVSDGGIHSHMKHLLALIEMAQEFGVVPLLHMITDGRDTSPESSLKFLDELEPALDKAGGSIVTVMGRYYAMDRDNRWDRVKLAWSAIVNGEGRKVSSARDGIESAWAADESDEFINPLILPSYHKPDEKDQFLFFNYRNDRPRELTEALAIDSFDGFDRGKDYKPFAMTTMTEYLSSFDLPVAFAKEVPETTLAQVISEAGLRQFHCAETEKYPHVTFFFNGGREEAFDGEDRQMVDSPKVSTYDLKPEMNAHELADVVRGALRSEKYSFIVCNFANGDMVGHTGVREAIIEAVETLDDVVDSVVEEAIDHGYSVVLTADHGNADLMVDPVTGGPHTQHTSFPVSCMVADKHYWRLLSGAGLSSIAPTVLDLMGLEKPEGMTGQSLLLEKL